MPSSVKWGYQQWSFRAYLRRKWNNTHKIFGTWKSFSFQRSKRGIHFFSVLKEFVGTPRMYHSAEALWNLLAFQDYEFLTWSGDSPPIITLGTKRELQTLSGGKGRCITYALIKKTTAIILIYKKRCPIVRRLTDWTNWWNCFIWYSQPTIMTSLNKFSFLFTSLWNLLT